MNPIVFMLLLGLGLSACDFSNSSAQDEKGNCANNPNAVWLPHLEWIDADNDGYVGTQTTILVCELPEQEENVVIDCDDDNGHVNPGANEYCDGFDNDCDGLIDDADVSLINGPWPDVRLTTLYADLDGDGYGDPTTALDCCDCDEWSNHVENGWDCDDSNAVLKAITEDADCDGLLTANDCDDSDPTTPNDRDCDGVLTAADCDDFDPGLLSWENDTDCDGIVAHLDCDDYDRSIGVYRFYRDFDGDGHGDPNTYSDGCLQSVGTSLFNDDCDDTDPIIHGGAPEVCDGIDNDCDNAIDDADPDLIGANLLFYVDNDGDGFGHSSTTTYACGVHPGVSTNNLDCNDQDAHLGDCAAMPDSIRLTNGDWGWYYETSHNQYGSIQYASCSLSAGVSGWVVGAGKHCPFSFTVHYQCQNSAAYSPSLSNVTEDISCGYRLVDIMPQTLNGANTWTFQDNGIAYTWFNGPSYGWTDSWDDDTNLDDPIFYSNGFYDTDFSGMNPSDLVPLDPALSWFESLETTCDDGLDNDQDGLVDCLDDHCDGVLHCQYQQEFSCSDGIDNDSDQRTDCSDLDCDGLAHCEYDLELTCTDGHDNDGDGLTDCHDSDCMLSHPSDCLDTDGDGVFFFEDCDDSNASVGSHFDIDADEPIDGSNPKWLGAIWNATHASVDSDFWFTRLEDKEDAFAFSFYPFFDGSTFRDGLSCTVDLSGVDTVELVHEGLVVAPSNIQGSTWHWSTLTPGNHLLFITPSQTSCFAYDVICSAADN